MIEKKECGIIHLPSQNLMNKGGKTIVYSLIDDNIVVSIAYCNKIDSYNKKIGVKVALDRLNTIVNEGLDKLPELENGIKGLIDNEFNTEYLFVIPQSLFLELVNNGIKAAFYSGVKRRLKIATYGTCLDKIVDDIINCINIPSIKDVSKLCLEQCIIGFINSKD